MQGEVLGIQRYDIAVELLINTESVSPIVHDTAAATVLTLREEIIRRSRKP